MRTIAVALASLIVIVPLPTCGQGSDGLVAMNQRSLRVAMDINESIQGALPGAMQAGDSQTVECLGSLRDTAMQVSDQIGDVSDLATVASAMLDPGDAKRAALIRDVSAEGALRILSVDRREVNQTAGECPNQALVQYKARDLIQLIDDATTMLQRFHSAA